ncbi:MAG TPA: hypothetical protein VF006_32545 [Longimicrobium sp.]
MYYRFSAMLMLPMTILAAGCGNPERAEAVHFTRLLTTQMHDVDEFDQRETRLIESMKPWVGQLSYIGACDTRGMFSSGGGATVRADARAAQNFAAQVEDLSESLISIENALSNEALEQPATQTMRTSLVNQLRSRRESLLQMRTLLQNVSDQVPQIANCFGAVPRSAPELQAILASYHPEYGGFATQVGTLRNQYQITDEELNASTNPNANAQ